MSIQKIIISDWLTKQNILPFNWNDSANEFISNQLISWDEIDVLKKGNFPFIKMDFVEFYFKDDSSFEGLNEIVVQIFKADSYVPFEVFDLGWLKEHQTFADISTKLDELEVEWINEKGPRYNTPNIRIPKVGLLAFDPERIEDNSAKLAMIYFKE